MGEIIPEPTKMILTLILNVIAVREGGAAEPASPRAIVDVAVSRKQKTCTLVAGELALSGTHAHTTVRPARLSKLKGRACPVVEDVLTRVKEVRFTFPRQLEEPFPVENGNDSAPASYSPVTGNRLDLQTLNGRANVVGDDVERGGLGGMVAEDVFR